MRLPLSALLVPMFVASAAALAQKPLVTCETFTCLYGFPDDHQGEEQTAEKSSMKLRS